MENQWLQNECEIDEVKEWQKEELKNEANEAEEQHKTLLIEKSEAEASTKHLFNTLQGNSSTQ